MQQVDAAKRENGSTEHPCTAKLRNLVVAFSTLFSTGQPRCIQRLFSTVHSSRSVRRSTVAVKAVLMPELTAMEACIFRFFRMRFPMDSRANSRVRVPQSVTALLALNMGSCCQRHGQTIIPDTTVAKALLYSDEEPSLSKDKEEIQSRFPVIQQLLPKLDEEIEVANLSNPSRNESFGLDQPIEAPYRLDFSTALTDLQKEGQMMQEKRQVVSQCSIVSIQRLTSPLSFRKETENSFDSEPGDKDIIGSANGMSAVQESDE